MRALTLLLATVLLAGCAITGIRWDRAAVAPPIAERIGQDVADLFRDDYAVDTTRWHIANNGQTPVRTAVADGLRRAGYEVIETFDSSAAPDGARALTVASVDADGLIVVTLALGDELLSRAYDPQAGQPVSAWSRRLT